MREYYLDCVLKTPKMTMYKCDNFVTFIHLFIKHLHSFYSGVTHN